MKQSKKKKIRILLSVILSLLMAVCIISFVRDYMQKKKVEDKYEEIRTEERTEGTESEIVAEETSETEMVVEDMPEIDFEKLWEINTDVCAWIYVPGTKVDYPVLRNESATDKFDDFYLRRSIEKVDATAGAIYMEPINQGDFSDSNTVLYGHNMNAGTMFASLHMYKDETFLNEHPYVYIVTPEKNLIYEIFGVISYDNRHIMRTYDFEKEEEYQMFLDSLEENHNLNDILREDLNVTTKDRILTLSTCIKGQPNNRLLVEAVLTYEYEKK